jgi:exosortase A
MNASVSRSLTRLEPRELAVLSLIAGVASLVAVAYWDSYRSMTRVWESTQYGHGMLVLPVVGLLLWRLRQRLAQVDLEPFAWGILPMIGLILIWFVGAAIGVQVVEQLAVVLLIPATILAFLGWPLVRTAMFPLLFAAAAVPIGDGLVPHLMQATADLSTALLQASGVPVFRQGQFLSLPGGDFEVADVCAGMQYLTAGTIIALLFSYLTYRSYAKRLLFVATTAVAMVVTNSVRASVVMLVASATDMRYFVGRDHVYFGWILFGVVIVALIYVASRFGDDEGAEPGGESALPAPRRGTLAPYRNFGAALALCGAAVVLGSGPLLRANRPEAALLTPPALALPAIDGCAGPGAWAGGARPEFEAPDAAISGTYSCSDAPVNVFVAVYLNNVQGREVVSDSNTLFPTNAWRQIAPPERQEFAAANGRTIGVNEVQLDLSGSRWLAWYWYAVGDETVTSGAAVKLTQALQVLINGRADGSAYLVQTPLDASIESSRQRLARGAREVAGL